METTIRIQTERVDDFVLLIEILKQAGLAEIVDRHIPRHGLQQGLSWGWVTVIWLSHIVSGLPANEYLWGCKAGSGHGKFCVA
jgi:transposase